MGVAGHKIGPKTIPCANDFIACLREFGASQARSLGRQEGRVDGRGGMREGEREEGRAGRQSELGEHPEGQYLQEINI